MIDKWFDNYPKQMFVAIAILVVSGFCGLYYLLPPIGWHSHSTPTLPAITPTECSDSIHMHITRVPLSSHMEAMCPVGSDFVMMQTGSVENIYFICRCNK